MSNHYATVPGAQVTNSERDYIRKLAQETAAHFEAPLIVNIGIMWGCTLWCLRDGAPDAVLYGVDIEPERWPISDADLLHAKILKGDSRVMPFYDDIHLLLIDGDHHYETICSDIANWMPHVVPGGSVIFHDYAPSRYNMDAYPELEGVKRAVDEWAVASSEWKQLAVVDSVIAFGRSE